MRKLSTGIILLALTVASTSCGDGVTTDGSTIGADTTLASSSSAAPRSSTTEAADWDPSICDRDNTEDCAVAALVFDEAKPLSEALTITSDWLALAVFRAEPACVVAATFSPSPEDRVEVPSWFAYVEAEGIEPRVRNNPGTPPITGAFINESYWDHFVAEWQQTKAEDALIAAVVVHTPTGTTVSDAGLASVIEVVPVDSYRRDSLDERYPGELYIRDHAAPERFRIGQDSVDCGA